MSGPRWDVAGARWPNRAHSRFVDAGGLRWHVQLFEAAGEAAPVLLLLHGTGAATHSWRALAPMLADGFRVVAPDLPGHGFTTGRLAGGASMPAMARAIGALLETLGVTPGIVVGHSAGAALALRMTIDGIVRPNALVGLGAALTPLPGIAALLFPGLARALFVNPFAPHLFARMARVPGETARFLARSTGSRIDAAGVADYAALFGTARHCAGAIAMMAEWDLGSLDRDLPRVTTPMLLLHGERDAAIPLRTARVAAARIAAATFVALPGLGHLAHEEDPAVIAVRIRDFWGLHHQGRGIR